MISLQVFDLYTDRATISPVDTKEKQEILPLSFPFPTADALAKLTFASKNISHLCPSHQAMKTSLDMG